MDKAFNMENLKPTSGLWPSLVALWQSKEKARRKEEEEEEEGSRSFFKRTLDEG